MGKISKLFKGELKKIFLSVGIFFMSAFLILTLTIAPKFFDPVSQEDITNITTISSSSVKQSYNSFIQEKSNIESSKNNVEQIYSDLINNNEDFKAILVTKSETIYNLRQNLNGYIKTGTNAQKLNCINNMLTALEEYKTLYNNYLNEHYLPLILVTENLDFDIQFELENLTRILNKSGDKNSADYYIQINNELENYGSAYNLNKFSNAIKNLAYSSASLTELQNNYKNKHDDYKAELLNDIEGLYNEANTDNEFNISYTNISKIKELEYNYLSVDFNYTRILEDGLLIETSKKYSDAELSSYLKFEDFNSYKINENYTKYVYLYNNNMKNSDYANVFAFNSSSSPTSSTFDYMYFTLELSSVLIILFTVIIGANIISKEYSEGTIKLLLIRPFSRNKIVYAKVLTTLFFGFIFVLIATVVSLITGCILFQGISLTESVLLIINSNLTLVVPIWLEFLMYLGCLLIKIWIYTLLAIAISVLFKSNILSVCLSAGIYILNLVVTFIAKGASWLKYNIFASLDLFKYFGGSFQINSLTNENLNNLLTSHVFAGTSILLPIIIICSMALVLNLIIFTVFKNRDLN